MRVDEIITLFRSVADEQASELSPDMMVRDAGISSLDIMRFLVLLETEHGIEIGGEQIESIANGSFQDLANSINLINRATLS